MTAHRLSAVTSEAIAYRRIISERQRKEDEFMLITRWSTPPKFGLSPPGNSRLAKRRSLKRLNFANSISPDANKTIQAKNDDCNTPSDSSPESNTLLCRDFERLQTHQLSNSSDENSLDAHRYDSESAFTDSSPEDLYLAKKIEY